MKTSTKPTRRSTRQRLPDTGGGILAVLAENGPSSAHEDDPSVSAPIKKTTKKNRSTAKKAVVFSPERIVRRKIEIDDEEDDAISELTSDLGSTLLSSASSQVATSPSSVAASDQEDDSEEDESEEESEDEGEDDEVVSLDEDEEESREISNDDDDTEAEDDSANGDEAKKVTAWKEKKQIKFGDDEGFNDDDDSEMEYDNDDEYDPDGDETEFEDDDEEEDSEELELDDDDLRITQKRSTVPSDLSNTKNIDVAKDSEQSSNLEKDKMENEVESEDGSFHQEKKEPESDASGNAIGDDDASEKSKKKTLCTKDSSKQALVEKRVATVSQNGDICTHGVQSISQGSVQSKEESDDESVVVAEIIDDESFSDNDSILEAEVETDDEPIALPKSSRNTSGSEEVVCEIKSPIAESMQKSVVPRIRVDSSFDHEKPSREPNLGESEDKRLTVNPKPERSIDPERETLTEEVHHTDTTNESDAEDDFATDYFDDNDSIQDAPTNPSDAIHDIVLKQIAGSLDDDKQFMNLTINDFPEDSVRSSLHQESQLRAQYSISGGSSKKNVTPEAPFRNPNVGMGGSLLKYSSSIGADSGISFQPHEGNKPMQEDPVVSAEESAKNMAQVNRFKADQTADNKLKTGLSMKSTIDLKDVSDSKISRPLGKFFPRTRSEGSVKQGQWTLGSRIGTGSFGVVHVGMNNRSGSLMAVKSIPMQPAIMKDIRREIELLKSLDHTNIVRYYGAEINGPNLHIFQEWVAGGSVSDLLSKFGPFPFPVIQSYAEQTLQGLAYLHSNNILHRDIKGSNLLVSDEGIVKLADFGGSRKIAEFHSDMMMSMTIRGTPYFMAPEVFEEKYSSKADIWAVGCVLYQMVTASAPWKNLGFNNPFSLCRHLQTTDGPPPLPRTLPASDGNQLNNFLALLGRCFCRTPFERPCVTALFQDPFFLEKGYSSDDDHSVGPGLFSPEVIRTRDGRLTSPLSSVKMTAKHVSSPAGNPSSQTPPRPRRNSIGTPLSPFLSPPLPKRATEKKTKASVLYSPAKDSSDWPDWAVKKYNERSVENGLTSMMDSLALSTDSSTQQLDSLLQTSSIKGLEFLSE
eukprot:scaffold294_cov221-Amphora_coffeaeformis.AAC.64